MKKLRWVPLSPFSLLHSFAFWLFFPLWFGCVWFLSLLVHHAYFDQNLSFTYDTLLNTTYFYSLFCWIVLARNIKAETYYLAQVIQELISYEIIPRQDYQLGKPQSKGSKTHRFTAYPGVFSYLIICKFDRKCSPQKYNINCWEIKWFPGAPNCVQSIKFEK